MRRWLPAGFPRLPCSLEVARAHVLWPDTLESRCAAACAADPTVVICCGGATRLWEVRACRSVPVHATTTSTGLVLAGGPQQC